jgi:hypothetical protein
MLCKSVRRQRDSDVFSSLNTHSRDTGRVQFGVRVRFTVKVKIRETSFNVLNINLKIP